MVEKITKTKFINFIKISRYILGYLSGVFLLASSAVFYISGLLNNIPGNFGSMFFMLTIIPSYFLNFALSALIMGVGSRKSPLKFWVLFSQPVPVFLAFILLSLIVDPALEHSDPIPPGPSGTDYLIVIGTFLVLTSIGAYWGMTNPLKKK